MVGVVFVFVREDASEAEALAEAFDAAGFSITGNSLDDNALAVVIWSRKALRSAAFRDAAERALRSDRAVVASLIAALPEEALAGAPVVDLSAWDGEDSAALDPLFEAADEIVRTAANVIVLPARPVYEDAEFVELPPLLTSASSERTKRMRRSWEAPIPTHMLHPVRKEAPQRLGASSPRRDFRRLGKAGGSARAHAALAFAVLALLSGGVFAMNVAREPTPRAPAAQTQVVDTGGVSLTSASADATGLEDSTPVEPAQLFEPPPQVGRAGLEPPSARHIRRASYAPRYARGDDRAAYEPPALIPDAMAADIQRNERGG